MAFSLPLLSRLAKALAKWSQHVNATYRNIVGRNMLLAFGRPVATRCDILGVVGSSLKMVKFEPTTPNMSQQGGQTRATCCAQECYDMLSWHVAIVWPGLKALEYCVQNSSVTEWKKVVLTILEMNHTLHCLVDQTVWPSPLRGCPLHAPWHQYTLKHHWNSTSTSWVDLSAI